jgi:hypothetical protein
VSHGSRERIHPDRRPPAPGTCIANPRSGGSRCLLPRYGGNQEQAMKYRN